MLDRDNAYAFAPQPVDQLHCRLDFLVPESRHDLIDEQEARPAREGFGQLEPSRIGHAELAGPRFAELSDADEFQQPVRSGESITNAAIWIAAMHRAYGHVLADGQAAERLHDLEGARHAAVRNHPRA